MLGGWLHPLENRVLHVASYFPVLLTFSLEDTTGVAHPTPDYGRPRPKAEVQDGRLVSAPQVSFQRNSVLQSGLLSVLVSSPDIDPLVFDLYDVDEIEYKHSVRLPLDGDDAVYVPRARNDIVATVDEITVNIYEVQYPAHSPQK